MVLYANGTKKRDTLWYFVNKTLGDKVLTRIKTMIPEKESSQEDDVAFEISKFRFCDKKQGFGSSNY